MRQRTSIVDGAFSSHAFNVIGLDFSLKQKIRNGPEKIAARAPPKPAWAPKGTSIRRQIPAKELEGMIDNIGLPVSGINLSYNDSGVAGPADADILVSLLPGHKPTADYVRNLRLSLNRDFPGIAFYFLPADIVTETINFGLPAPYDIQVVGRDQAANQKVANEIAQKIRRVRGAVDVRVQQRVCLLDMKYHCNLRGHHLRDVHCREIDFQAVNTN